MENSQLPAHAEMLEMLQSFSGSMPALALVRHASLAGASARRPPSLPPPLLVDPPPLTYVPPSPLRPNNSFGWWGPDPLPSPVDKAEGWGADDSWWEYGCDSSGEHPHRPPIPPSPLTTCNPARSWAPWSLTPRRPVSWPPTPQQEGDLFATPLPHCSVSSPPRVRHVRTGTQQLL